MEFDLPKDQSSIIKVIGVGGGGGNAVNHMFKQGIRDVNFVICNTDKQHLELSPVPNKIQLGPNLTEGMGAGAKPDIGMKATEESLDDIKQILESNTKMVFITAGMGGGTGTGGAPVIAKLAQELDLLTVGIVTRPFAWEGPQRMEVAEEGIEKMRRYVDTFLVISNDNLREIHGELDWSVAFAKANDILATAAKGIAEIITVPGNINVDFKDVNTIMRDCGAAIMGSGEGSGEDRAIQAVKMALTSPLLNDNDIKGAKNILLNIGSGTKEVTLDEVTEITDHIRDAVGHDTNIIFGKCDDESLQESLSITVIATGFESDQHKRLNKAEKEKVFYTLDNEVIEQPEIKNEDKEPPIKKKMKAKPRFTEDNQCTIEFDLTKEKDNATDQGIVESNEMSVENNKPPKVVDAKEEATEESFIEPQERRAKLRNLSMKLNNPSTVTEMENEPAYLRRNIRLEDQPHSSESNISKYALETDEDEENGKPEIKENNSFLHDNVD